MFIRIAAAHYSPSIALAAMVPKRKAMPAGQFRRSPGSASINWCGQLANFAGLERESSTMQGVLSQIGLRGPQNWVDIAAFLNKEPTVDYAQHGEGGNLTLGRAIVHEQCASCHSADGHGDIDGFVPSLRNQHYSYLVGQMNKLGEGCRHNVDDDLGKV